MTRAADLGPEAADPAELARRYAWPDTGDCWVRTNFVGTIDGVVQGSDGRSGTINTEADHQVFDHLRATADVVVVGAQTVRAEGYRAIDLSTDQQAVREARGQSGVPPLLVVSQSLALPHDLTDGTGEVEVITDARADPGAVADLASRGVRVTRGNDDQLTGAEIVDHCRSRGWHRVLCEGGPHLHSLLLAAGAVDEICLTVSPLVTGDPTASRLTAGDVDASQWVVRQVSCLADTVFLSWTRA
ncbi:dihydrofolate reductase family protein [Propionibacteriaceae bacterium Y2011]|uniref:dihydrofolate reductase family protein n=1 Tax=Microlunatus sp. Y2014 TaxID=3418488 RepID=UPI003B4726E8